MDLFSQVKPKASPEKVRQIKTWIYELWKIDLEIPISINQLRCNEPGCPPIETVIGVMTSPAQKYTIHKSVAEIEYTDLSEMINRTKGKAMERQLIALLWQETLGLLEEPTAIAFAKHPPERVMRVSEPAPSACTFWRWGQRQLFYATAEDHRHCPIGLMTMGFTLSPQEQEQAQSLVETMASLSYLRPDEVGHIPTIQTPHQVVVYGPLSQFPISPDLVLLMVTPYQAMLAAEVLGSMGWEQSSQFMTLGRPACAALPRAEELGKSTLSLGCVGARTYTDLRPEEMLLVVPGTQFEQATQQLATIANANQQLAIFHIQQRQSVANAQ